MLQNAIIRFPLYRKEECDDKKVDLNFLFPLFVLCLFCSLALEFWFVCCVSLSANRKWWMQWEREREEAFEVECWVRFRFSAEVTIASFCARVKVVSANVQGDTFTRRFFYWEEKGGLRVFCPFFVFLLSEWCWSTHNMVPLCFVAHYAPDWVHNI